MANLRPAAMQQILRELEVTRFGLVGFDVKFPDSPTSLVNITFLGAKGAALRMSESSQEKVYVTCSPGEFKSEDKYVVDTFDQAVESIQPWARRIHEDLRVRATDFGELSNFRQTLDAHLKQNVPDEQALFSDAEVNDLDVKLSALEQRLAEMEAKHIITEKELRDLKHVVTEARKDLPAMSKGMWYRTAGGKLWEVMKKAASTNEGRQVLADAAKKLLGL